MPDVLRSCARGALAALDGPARLGRSSYSETLPRTPEAARQARRMASLALGRWGLTGLEDAALLVVTELVANSVAHARRHTIRVTLLRRGLRGVRVRVTDFSTDLPQLRAAGSDDEDGRGLALVAALSDAWGVVGMVWGKTTWADLSDRGPR